ncbi:MAG: MFS transporter [Gammaproteobacteria bacterium]|nr:MFS transporter [Gammaproteobacteria bacterium]
MDRKTLSWALYDWANSAYATVVMAGFFPVFFKQYWAAGLAPAESTFALGLGNSASSILIALCAPVLGAIADRAGARKRLLLFFTVVGVSATASLYLVAQGAYISAVAFYAVATLGFMGGNLFYDALIVEVATEDRFDRVSAWGYALGYLGGGLLFAVLVAMAVFPQRFGFDDAAQVVRLSFVIVAVWWMVFSLPVLLFVRETAPVTAGSFCAAVRAGLRQLVETFHHLRQLRVVMLFLAAYWLYIDGVDTIIRMAVDYGLSLGFDSNDLITALLITQFVGFPAAIVFGRIGERFGAKSGIYIAIAVYMGVTVWAAFIETVAGFYQIAVVIGLVQGGIQSLSRALYARLIPPGKTAEFFGFYNMLGKFATVIGPVAMGWVALLTGSARFSVLALLVLFALGAVLLYFVDVEKGRGLRGGL